MAAQCLHPRAPGACGVGPARKAFWNECFDLGADRLAEYRRGAIGGNADDQWRAIDDGAEGEIAICRAVDDIDRHARGARRGCELRGFLIVRAIGYGDRGTGEIFRCPVLIMQNDRAAHRRGGERQHFLAGCRGKNLDTRAGGREQFGFPRRRRTAAGNDRALVFQREERRQPRQGADPG